MRKSSKYLLLSAVCAVLSVVPAAAQQDWPSKPIRMLSGSSGGGGSDVLGRIFGEYFQQQTGQPWVMDNRPGAGTTVAAGLAREASPDGYTFFVTQVGAHGIVPNVYASIPYSPLGDFDPVARLVIQPNVIFVRADDERFSDLEDLITAGKAEPKALSYGVSGVATTTNLTVAMLGIKTGLDPLMVAYKSSADTVLGLLRGDADFAVENIQMVSGRSTDLKPLAVTTAERSPQLPDVPTVIEAGVPDFNLASWFGIVAPKGTPPEILDKMAGIIEAATKDPETLKRLESLGATPAFMGPEEFTGFIESEIATWGEIATSANIPKQ